MAEIKEENKMKYQDKNWFRFAVTATIVFSIGIYLSWGLLFPEQQIIEKEAVVPINSHIEKEIEVKQLENKFIFVQRVAFGGAGAGGLGAPQIFTNNITQFSELVSPNEPVYVAFELREYEVVYSGFFDPFIKKNFALTKVYWALIENRAGVIIYEDSYQYSEGGQKFWIQEYTPQAVKFERSNREKVNYRNEIRPDLFLWIPLILLVVSALLYPKKD